MVRLNLSVLVLKNFTNTPYANGTIYIKMDGNKITFENKECFRWSRSIREFF